MIVRILVVDPNPRDPNNDIVVYQVPENSRAYELLMTMLEYSGFEFTSVKTKQFKRGTKAK